MRELTIAMAVIVQGDRFFLQFRDGDAKIGGAGLVGCFGGKIEPGEEASVAICRELGEETSLGGLQPTDFTYKGRLTVESDHQLEPVLVHVEVFELQLASDQKIEAREGQLRALSLAEILVAKDSLTSATKAYFEQLTKEAS